MLDLLDELEAELKINVRPLSWALSIRVFRLAEFTIFTKTIWKLYTPNKQMVSETVKVDKMEQNSTNL